MNEKANIFMMSNQKYFATDKLYEISERLNSMSDEQIRRFTYVEFKDPVTYLLISIFIGELGIDRFLMNDIGMGILKLLTGGLCGILWIYDICTIQTKVKEMNYAEFMKVV
ncbi:MAG: TM2 domain-containing protein [Clostridia bacterium]|jgi:hypothetical protein